ncbi:MAG: hypothetical protein PWP67_2814 [Clostridium butyricum]|nr:hypothetical protein [Clostridium butyricum]
MLNFNCKLILSFRNSSDKTNHYKHMKPYDCYMPICFIHRTLMI